MTGEHAALRTGAKRALVLTVSLWLLVAPTVAGVAGAGGGAGPVEAVAATADGSAASLAGATTVRLQPTTVDVDEGATRTLNVVVSSADGGVGAVEGGISIVESEYAEIVSLELRGNPGLDEVDISESGDSVTFEGALMDTPQTGDVTVAEVTVRGQREGTTDIALSIESLGDEDGDPYDVGGTPDTALTVENSRNEIPLSITASADSAAVGESVTYTVMRSDSDARVDANVTVGNRTIGTGVDGEATVAVRESMVADAGTITAVASKTPTTQERYANDSVTITFDESGSGDGTDSGGDDETTDDDTRTDSGTDGVITDDDTRTDSGTDGVIVRTEPEMIDLTPDETTTVGVVVTGVDAGVGAGNVTVTVADPDVVEISAASVTDDPGIDDAEIVDDGARATAEFALRDGADEAPVRILNVTLRGVAAGSTTLSLAADSLGDERGNSYTIGATPGSGLSVAEDAGDATTTGTDGGTATGTESGATDDPATESGSNSPTDAGTGTPGDGPSVPANPSTALLAFAVVGVILLGLGALAS